MHSTRPDARTEIAPVREAMRTELAAPKPEIQPALVRTPTTPASRRRPLLLLTFALIPVIAIVVLILIPTRDISESPAPIADPLIAAPTANTPVPVALSTPPQPPEAQPPEAQPPEAQPPEPMSTAAPQTEVPAPPPEEAVKLTKKPRQPFAVLAPGSLKKLRDSPGMRDCFANQPKIPLTVDVTISAATGDAKFTLPAQKEGSVLGKCIARVFSAWRFPRGVPGDPAYVTRRYNLNRAEPSEP